MKKILLLLAAVAASTLVAVAAPTSNAGLDGITDCSAGVYSVAAYKTISYSTATHSADLTWGTNPFSPGAAGDAIQQYIRIADASGNFLEVGVSTQAAGSVGYWKQKSAGVTTSGVSYNLDFSPDDLDIVKTASGWDAKLNGTVIKSSTALSGSGNQTRYFTFDFTNNSSTCTNHNNVLANTGSLTGYSYGDDWPYDVYAGGSTTVAVRVI